MTTAVQAPQLTLFPDEVEHTLTLGGTQYWCIQSACDLQHHVWCTCGH